MSDFFKPRLTLEYNFEMAQSGKHNIKNKRLHLNSMKQKSSTLGKIGGGLAEIGDEALVVDVENLNGPVVLVDDVQVDRRACADLHGRVLLPVVVVLNFVLLYCNLVRGKIKEKQSYEQQKI